MLVIRKEQMGALDDTLQEKSDSADSSDSNKKSGVLIQSCSTTAKEEQPSTITAWIELELLDEEGQPLADELYVLGLPDGTTVKDGELDQNGFARVDGIDPGTYVVIFPNIDENDMING